MTTSKEKKPTTQSGKTALRRRAEKELQQQPRPAKKLSRADVDALLHELQVHQIELEMQNEELRRSQQELEQTRDRYSDLYEFAPVGYLSLSPEGVILQANLTSESMLGIERSRLAGSPLSRWVASEDACPYHLWLRGLADVRAPQTLELRLKKDGGGTFWARLQAAPAPTESDPQPLAFRIAVSDVTEQKRAEEQLAEKQKFLEIITSATPDIVYLYDPQQQRHMYINRELESLLGYSSEEIKKVGADLLLKNLHPQDLPRVMEHIQTLASARDDSFHELEYDSTARSRTLITKTRAENQPGV